MKELFRRSKKEKKEIINKITRFLKRKPEIVFAYLHGSFVEQRDTPFKDIDIATYVNPFGQEVDFFNYRFELADEIEKNIKLPIDVRVLNTAPFYFQNNVFRNGILLFSRDEKLRTDLIEESSLESTINFGYSRESLKELIP